MGKRGSKHRRAPEPRPPLGVVARCPACGKGAHASRELAKRYARAVHPGERLNAYACDLEGGHGWHLGHLPPAVLTGELDRAEATTRPRADLRQYDPDGRPLPELRRRRA